MIHVLENDALRLELSPEIGAGIVNLLGRVEGEWQPLLRRTTPEGLEQRGPSALASFTLAPYSNRIPGGAFVFRGRTFQLRPTTPEGNAQHGDVRRRAHREVAVSAVRAEYLFDSREVDDFNWPVPMMLRTEYVLSSDTVTQTLDLTNVGTEPMPAGLGIHPYFERHVAGAPDVEVSFLARGVYLTDASLIPTGAMVVPVPAELDFSVPRILGDTSLNTGYGGYEGLTVLRYVGTPYALELRSDPVLSHLVVYTAPDGTLAVEPVSHATNAFNLHEQGVEGTGFRVLEPGESLRTEVSFRLVSA